MAILKAYRDRYPRVSDQAFVAETAVLIGDVVVEAGASIWYGCVLRGDVAPIHIGAGSNIQDGCVIHVASRDLNGVARPTSVGANVTVGHMAMLHACTLEEGSFVGMKACVMDGAVVETGAMVAAGALVPAGKRVPSGELWMGSPAKFARHLTPQEREFLLKSAHLYQLLASQSTFNPLATDTTLFNPVSAGGGEMPSLQSALG
jgi:gamma-carbonic anhydrase